MADDIEQILDSVERQLFRNKSAGDRPNFDQKREAAANADPEVAQLLNDLEPSENVQRALPEAPCSKQPSSEAAKKCFPLLLGCAESLTGLSTIPTPRACDRLRCTSCDRCIVALSHSSWLPGTDALFLRQAAVQPSQLNLRLEPQEGARAYACQCHCLAVPSGTKPVPQGVPWVCGKHGDLNPEQPTFLSTLF